MLDVNSISLLLNDPQINPNLRRHPLAAGQRGPASASGQGPDIPALGSGSSRTGFQELIALAQAQAQAGQSAGGGGAVDREAARGLARLRASGLQTEMLSSLIDLEQNGEGSAAGLVERMNLEALLASDQFGNLLGQKNAVAGLDTGRTFSPRQMSSRRQKNEGLDLRPAGAAGPGESLFESREGGNLNMPYGLIRPPKRPVRNLAEEQAAPARTAALKNGPAVPEPSGAPVESEKEISAARKNDARDDGFSMKELDKLVNKVGLALGLDPDLVKAVIKTESNFNHRAVSRVGAKGLMQLMPATAKDLGVEDPFNPVENVWGGARYLKKMLDRHGGNVNQALASYNWGPGNLDRHGSRKMPKETRNYISIVNKHYAGFKKNGGYQA
ncbi:MAG: lytic transglycosylase domain-containing protein [Candidatus Adiutrix sp.]|jgi:hypothetical protein|nr:lytic transglycosylase domain-containing protein [Candidatus Adiutrix sp.]